MSNETSTQDSHDHKIQKLRLCMERQPTPTAKEAAESLGLTLSWVRNVLFYNPDIPRREPGMVKVDTPANVQKLIAFMSRRPTPTIAEAAQHLGAPYSSVSRMFVKHPDIPRRSVGMGGEGKPQTLQKRTKPDQAVTGDRKAGGSPTPQLDTARAKLDVKRNQIKQARGCDPPPSTKTDYIDVVDEFVQRCQELGRPVKAEIISAMQCWLHIARPSGHPEDESYDLPDHIRHVARHGEGGPSENQKGTTEA